MKDIMTNLRNLREQALKRQVMRGKAPAVRITNDFLRFRFIGVFILGALAGLVIATCYFVAYKHQGVWEAIRLSWRFGLDTGGLFLFFYCIYPLVCIISTIIDDRHWPRHLQSF